MYNMKKSLLAMLLLIVMLFTQTGAYAAELPYDTYNYDYWDNIVYTPAAYVPKGSVQGTSLLWNGAPLGDFATPQDMCVSRATGDIYVADTGNNRIVVLDDSMTTVLKIYDSFDNAGTPDAFKAPKGVAVTEDGSVYVADSENNRIVVLDAEGKLLRVVEIPQTAMQVKAKVGGTAYTVGTHIEGMPAAAKLFSLESGEAYAAVNVAAGSAAAVTDEATGLTYTISAEAEELQAFQTAMTVGGMDYVVMEDGKTIVRKPEGTDMPSDLKAEVLPEGVAVYSRFDPIPKKDIFVLIGRMVKTIKRQTISMSTLNNIKGVWADEDGSVYAVSDKTATKLTGKGTLVRGYGSYKDAANASKSFTNITEFAVADELIYMRENANLIAVLQQDGDTEKLITNNAVTVTDADGNVTVTLTGFTENGAQVAFEGILGVELLGDMLLVGMADGTVAVLNKSGELIKRVENNTVLKLDAQGVITDTVTTVVNGKVTERFSGLTGVAVMDGKLCVAGENNRTWVIGEDGAAVQVAQNNCVIETDRDGVVTRVISSIDADGEAQPFATINGVEGVAFNSAQQLCIADSRNQLIVIAADGSVARVNANADSEALDANFKFSPLKVSVDYAGRIYCIAQNMFEGIMVFETNGDFTGFFGTIQVSISAWDKFWRKLATKEERSKQQLFIPTEFTGIDIDAEGFVYASNVDTTGVQAVRRLNPKGEDVIRQGANANLGGDIAINGTAITAGASKIVDVVYRDKGVYSLLDSKRGRIFTYDHEGNLLYIFGGLGTQAGAMQTPVAIEYAKDRILTLDAKQNAILIYGETEYGRLINDAVGLRFDGDETKAVELWQEVLRLDENNELANSGIGKAYLSAGDNEKAMEYLERGMNREYYSVAFKRLRNEVFKQNVSYVLTGVVVLAAAAVVYFKAIKPRIKAKREGRV